MQLNLGRTSFIWIFLILALAFAGIYAAPRLNSKSAGDYPQPTRSADGLTPLLAAQISAVARATFVPAIHGVAMPSTTRLPKEKQLTVLNVWATWCPPCRAEMPEFIRFRKHHLSAVEKGGIARDVGVVLVSADDLNQRDNVLKFLKSVSVHFDSYIVGEDAPTFMRALSPSWKGGLPATYILDTDGVVLEQFVGATTEAALEARVRELGKTNAAAASPAAVTH